MLTVEDVKDGVEEVCGAVKTITTEHKVTMIKHELCCRLCGKSMTRHINSFDSVPMYTYSCDRDSCEGECEDIHTDILYPYVEIQTDDEDVATSYILADIASEAVEEAMREGMERV